jgi:asparagine synthase (glutamine-hydrolysing)
MCGFVGSYPSQDKPAIEQAVLKIKHRGPDEQAVKAVAQGVLGHARLSIVDVAGSHQPMCDQERWIVFNGEIYNFAALRAQLPGQWASQGDTEVVLRLFGARRQETVEMLDGMFAFAILNGGLFLARDPVGIKPLYYAQDGQDIHFASEIKALLHVPGEIHEFPAGHWWDAAHGFVRYFHIDDLQWNAALPKDLPQAQIEECLRHTLRQAVQKRLIADPGIPVGISLSGGLDSSLIAALAREGRTALDTFVVGMTGSEDVTASQQVADALGTRHHIYIYTFDEMLKALPEVIYHLESFDAALVRSAIPNYFLARLASGYVKVILTGEGADELFGGYEYLRGVSDAQRFQRELWTITTNLHNTNLQRTDRMTMAHSIEGRVPFLDKEMLRLALSLPAELKFHGNGIAEKALLRRAFAGIIPEAVLQRPKQKFSAGAGSINLLARYANDCISNAELVQARQQHPEARLRSKEELLYYRIFGEQFGARMTAERVGRTRSVTRTELQ